VLAAHSIESTAAFLDSFFFLHVLMATPHIPKLAVTLAPLGDRVVVLPLEAEKVTASGLIIPDTAKEEKPQEGIVLAMGEGGIGKDCADPSKVLKAGQKVLFGKYAGDDVKIKDKDGKEHEVKILHLDSILAIVE
jgi:chaperonin GroES